MRTRAKWFIAGGAAAFVLTPVAAVSGSTTLDDDLPQRGLVIEAQAVSTVKPSAGPTAKPSKTEPSGKAKKEPAGKKTVSAASPVSPHTAPSPKTPASPNSPN